MAQEKDNEKGLNRPEDVRDRKRVEETVRGQADLLQKTFNSMTDAIFILEAKAPPAAPTILECNEAASAIFGYDKTEMLGKTTDFLHVSEGTLREFQSQLYSAVQQGRFPFHLQEFRMKRKDGSVFPSEHSVSQLLNDKGERTGWISIVRDITERKRAEEGLRRAEAQYHAVVESQTELICRYKADGTFTFVNEAYCRYFGKKPEELIGHRFMPLPPEDRENVRKKMASISADNPTVSYEQQVILPSGEVRWQEWMDRGIFDDKLRLVEYQSVGRDITERKQMEEALGRSEERFRNIFATTPDCVFIKDIALRYVEVNPAVEKLAALPASRLIGLGDEDIFGEEAAVHLRENDSRVLKGEIIEDDEIAPYQGVPRIFHTIKVPLRESSGIIIGILGTARDITERKRMEEALRDSLEHEKLLSDLVRNASLAVSIGYPDGRIGSCNPAFSELTGYTVEELKTIDWNLNLTPPEWREFTSAKLQELAHTKKAVRYEKEYIRKDGSRVPIELVVHPKYDSESNLQYYFAFVTDITERKRAEEALRRRVEELAALQATVLDITGRLDLPTLLQTIVERAARLLGAPAGGMYLCDPEKQEARCMVSYNTPHDYTGAVLKYGQGAAGIVAQTGEPLVVDDYRTWQGRATAFEEERPFSALLTVPMIWQSRVTGVIHVLDDTASRRFTQADQELLTLFANHAAIAVENARMLEQEKRHAEEIRRYSTNLERLVFERTKKVSESERRFRELADLLPQIVFEIDGNGNVQYMNRAGFAATGLSEEEFSRGLNASRVLAPAEHDRAVRGMRRIMGGEMIGEREFTVLRRDGTTFPVIVYTAPILREGKSAGLRGIAIDITERKRMEEKLRAAREQLEYVVTSNPAVIYAGKPLADYSDWHLTYISESVLTMLGFEPKDFVGHPEFWERHLPPEDVRRVLAEVPRFWEEGHHTFEYRFLHKDGTYRWIREEAKVIRDAAGKPVEAMGYWTDVTERKRMEEEIRASKERLEYVVASNPAVIYTGKPFSDYTDFDFTYVSGNITMLLGCDVRDFIDDPRFWSEHVHPDDRQRVAAEIPRVFTEDHLDLEYRFRHKDGTYRWIRERTG